MKTLKIFLFCSALLGSLFQLQAQILTPPIITSSGTSICPGQSVTLSTPAQAGASYQWIKDPSWMNTSSIYSGTIDRLKFALDNNNVPYVVYNVVNWVNGVNTGRMTVKKYIGGSWIAVGLPDFESAFPSSIDFKIGINNVPYIVFSDALTQKCKVMKFDGTNWVYVGTPGFSPASAASTKIAISSTGVPYVAYADGSKYWQGIVKKFDGSNWVSLGNPSFSASEIPNRAIYSSDQIDIGLDANDVPYVFYRDDSFSNENYVDKFNGTKWVNTTIGTVEFQSATDLNLTFDKNNIPCISYRISTGLTAYDGVMIKKLSGTTWSTIQNGFIRDCDNISNLAFDQSNAIYLSGINSMNIVEVRKHNGNNWVTLGSIGQKVGHRQIGVDKKGVPYLSYWDDWAFTVNAPGVIKFDGTTVGTNSNSYAANTTGNYFVKTSNANGGAYSINNITITDSPLPSISVTPATNTVCSGASATLTASGATSYVWSPATGLNTTTGATVSASPTATTTYTVTGTTGSCTNTKTVTVTVNSTPTIAITPAISTICSGSSVGLTASGATTYAWSPATGLSATTGATVAATPTATTTYTVTGTTGTCTNTKTVTITVNPKPTVAITPATSSICIGASATLTAVALQVMFGLPLQV